MLLGLRPSQCQPLRISSKQGLLPPEQVGELWVFSAPAEMGQGCAPGAVALGLAVIITYQFYQYQFYQYQFGLCHTCRIFLSYENSALK